MNRRSPRLRDRLREATVHEILRAAEDVFAAEGLHDASMAAIADRAGVAVGTLYNHFAHRDALLGGLCSLRRTELLDRLDAALREAARRPFADRLEAALGALLGHFEAHRRFMLALLQAEQGGSPRGPGPAETMRAVYERLERLVRGGVRDGALRSDGAELFPAFLMGLLRGVAMRELYAPDATPFSARAADVARFFLAGARKR